MFNHHLEHLKSLISVLFHRLKIQCYVGGFIVIEKLPVDLITR